MFFNRHKKGIANRAQIRSLVQLPVTFTQENDTIVQRGIIIDISRGGVLILKLPARRMSEYCRPLRMQDKLYLKFHLPIMTHEVNASGIVRHIDKKDKDFPSVVCVGIEFAEIPSMDQNAIADFVNAGMSAVKDPEVRNKRKFARLPLDIPIVFSDDKGKYFSKAEGKIINLSAAGMLVAREKKFFSSRLVSRIEKGGVGNLVVRFRFSPRGKKIKVLCKICRIVPGVDEFDDCWCLGLQFLELDKEEQKIILKFVALERERLMQL